jgi:hypothetical protein
MKNAYEVLNEREAELARVRKEIESLSIVARLLADDDDGKTASDELGQTSDDSNKTSSPSLNETTSRLSDAAAASAETLFSSAPSSRLGFWSALKRAI